MNPIAMGALVFACTFCGFLTGMLLQSVLPEHHVGSNSKDTIKLAVGIVATMSALVLGLITATVKSSFDGLSRTLGQTSAEILTLDRTLARYGPETKDVREDLRLIIGHRLAMTWPEDSAKTDLLDTIRATQVIEGLDEHIRHLSPQNDDQRWLKTRAQDQVERLLGERWLMLSGADTSVPAPFLGILVFWLTVTFLSWGLFAPRNGTVIAVLLVCALSVGCAIFLIIEMDAPFSGLIKVSPDPLRYAYSRINQ
jgi:hypothetical protein